MTSFERFNLYTSIHKALRHQMCDVLVHVGRLDVHDADELPQTLARVETLLQTFVKHLTHENDFLHTALEARALQASHETAADHVEHLEAIASLRDRVARLASAPASQRDALALGLYRELALFVADNLQHMQVEETANMAVLWAHYSDAELFEIHDRLVASLPPEEHLTIARWMVPACTPAERAQMFAGMKAQMPPEALLGVFSFVEPHLDAAGRDKLKRAIEPVQAGAICDAARRLLGIQAETAISA